MPMYMNSFNTTVHYSLDENRIYYTTVVLDYICLSLLYLINVQLSPLFIC